MLEACRELDVALIAYPPLASGALTGKYLTGPRPRGLPLHPPLPARHLETITPVVVRHQLLARVDQRHPRSSAAGMERMVQAGVPALTHPLLAALRAATLARICRRSRFTNRGGGDKAGSYALRVSPSPHPPRPPWRVLVTDRSRHGSFTASAAQGLSALQASREPSSRSCCPRTVGRAPEDRQEASGHARGPGRRVTVDAGSL